MERTKVIFPKLLDHQQEALDNLKALNWLCWGAQGGKTRLCMYAQTAFALDVPRTDNIWIDRDGKFARDAFRLAGALYPADLVRDKSKVDLRYELVNGSVHSFFSGLEPDAFRGKTRNSAVFNEFAFLPQAAAESSWREVIAPRLDGWAIFNSTPKGRRHFSFELWVEAGNQPDLWQRSHYPTTANPRISAARIEMARRILSESQFRQEILAEFVSDFGRFFNPNPKCWTGKFESHDPKGKYVAGLDWAKHKDYTAFAILRIDTFPRRLVHVGRLPHLDYTAQVPILAAMFQKFGNPPILADASEDTANELMQRAGCNIEEFVFSQSSKQYIMDKLRVAVEQAEIVMPPSPKRVKELQEEKIAIPPADTSAYTQEQLQATMWLDDEFEFFEPYLRGGRLQFGARGAHHDDILAALMMANEKASRVLSGAAGGIVHISSGGRGLRM